MRNHLASHGALRPLRPLLLLTFAVAAAACSGGAGDGADAPELPEAPGDTAGPSPVGQGRLPGDEPHDDATVPPTEEDTDVSDDTAAAPPPSSEPAAPGANAPGAPVPNGWLYTEGNRIYDSSGAVWQGRGANIADVRGCNACGDDFRDPEDVKRRIDTLVDEWGATFLRLTLESQGESDILTDAEYMDMIEDIVDHVGTKPGVYVMVANWISPTFSEMGWPTSQTEQEWEKLAERFADDKHVIFGLVNEPEENTDGAHDAQVWTSMNSTVAAIRAVEEAKGTPPHIIAVQGTGGWSRLLAYYVENPITAGDGVNIAYEVHVYDGVDKFGERFIEPSQTIPVIIGEFGPWDPYMNLADSKKLVDEADELQVPWLAWTFHMRCPPNLIEDLSEGGCGIDMPLKPTPWGKQIQQALKNKPKKPKKS